MAEGHVTGVPEPSPYSMPMLTLCLRAACFHLHGREGRHEAVLAFAAALARVMARRATGGPPRVHGGMLAPHGVAHATWACELPVKA
eukprot:353478-Chlamydomonas_euryale.AAC.4